MLEGGELCADGATLHIYLGVTTHVTVLTAAKDRAGDGGAVFDVHHGVLHIGQVAILGIVQYACCHTTTRPEDESILTTMFASRDAAREGVGTGTTVGANASALDGDGGQTSCEVGAVGLQCGLGLLVGLTDRGQRAAAIDGTIDGAALNGDIGVAGYLAGRDAVVAARRLVNASATAINVAAVNHVVAQVGISNVALVQSNTHGAALNLHIGVSQDVTVLATTEDAAIDGAALEGHIGSVHKRVA